MGEIFSCELVCELVWWKWYTTREARTKSAAAKYNSGVPTASSSVWKSYIHHTANWHETYICTKNILLHTVVFWRSKILQKSWNQLFVSSRQPVVSYILFLMPISSVRCSQNKLTWKSLFFLWQLKIIN